VAQLERLGFSIVQAQNLLSCHGFLAGSDDERVHAFHSLLETEVEAVLFARGGHGVLRIIDRIDWDLVASRPRWFVGYSDLTPFLLEVSRRTGWMTLHGPMVATELERGLERRERETLLAALSGAYDFTWEVQRAGTGGTPCLSPSPLFGGCLSLLCATLGTFAQTSWRFDDAIVFLEDVGEAPYKVDRFLAQLGLAGLGGAKAVVFGHCRENSATRPWGGDRGANIDAAVVEILGDHSNRLNVPFYYGLEAGHGTPNLTLPLGAKAAIDGTHMTVTTQECSIAG